MENTLGNDFDSVMDGSADTEFIKTEEGIGTDNSAIPLPAGKAPERLYTLLEVAEHLGIREDDLIALLPDIAIVVESPMIEGFTSVHIELLEQLIANVKMYAEESVYRGGDL